VVFHLSYWLVKSEATIKKPLSRFQGILNTKVSSEFNELLFIITAGLYGAIILLPIYFHYSRFNLRCIGMILLQGTGTCGHESITGRLFLNNMAVKNCYNRLILITTIDSDDMGFIDLETPIRTTCDFTNEFRSLGLFIGHRCHYKQGRTLLLPLSMAPDVRNC